MRCRWLVNGRECDFDIVWRGEPSPLRGVGFGGGECLVLLQRVRCEYGHVYSEEVGYVEASA